MRKLHRTVLVLGLWAGCAAWVPTSLAAGAAVDAATDEQKQSAQKLFLDAKKNFDEKQFEPALEGFRASYDVVASPNSLLMVARTLVALDRIEEGYDTYQEVIRTADEAAAKDPKYAPAAEAARKEVEEIRPRLGFLSLDIVGATADTQIFINEKPIERDRWGKEIVARVGVVSISAKAPGKPEYNEDVTLGGEAVTHRIDLASLWAPPPPPVTPTEEPTASGSVDLLGLDMRTWSYIAGGVGAAGVVTFGVFGVMNRSKYNSLESDCPNGLCATDRSDDIDAGKRYQTIANVGLVVGVVGLGTGTALYLLSNKKGREEPTTQVGIGPGSVTVQGTF
jgi:hypothetical protein